MEGGPVLGQGRLDRWWRHQESLEVRYTELEVLVGHPGKDNPGLEIEPLNPGRHLKVYRWMRWPRER